MSRFVIASSDGKEFVYGWDRRLDEYFMTSETTKGFRSYVGGSSAMAGTGANLWKAMARYKIIPPMRHAREMRYDLPLSESWASPANAENGLYGIVIAADGIQTVDFIDFNAIDTRFENGDGQSMTDSYLQGY